jgi:hypothetical protein
MFLVDMGTHRYHHKNGGCTRSLRMGDSIAAGSGHLAPATVEGSFGPSPDFG